MIMPGYKRNWLKQRGGGFALGPPRSHGDGISMKLRWASRRRASFPLRSWCGESRISGSPTSPRVSRNFANTPLNYAFDSRVVFSASKWHRFEFPRCVWKQKGLSSGIIRPRVRERERFFRSRPGKSDADESAERLYRPYN